MTSPVASTMALSRARAAKDSSGGRSRPWSTISARATRIAWWTESTETGASTAGSRNVCGWACPVTVSVSLLTVYDAQWVRNVVSVCEYVDDSNYLITTRCMTIMTVTE